MTKKDTGFLLPKPCAWCGGKVITDNLDDYEQTMMILDSQPDTELVCGRCWKIGKGGAA